MMTLKDRWNILALKLRENGEPSTSPATSDEVRNAERELGLVFPESYQWFLHEFGAISWPLRVYGTGSDVRPGSNVVRLTMRERTDVEPELPLHLLPIAPDGWGNHYCLETAQMVEKECPVVFWSHELERDQPCEPTHDSFVSWLEEQVGEAEG